MKYATMKTKVLDRKREMPALLRMSPDEVVERAGPRLRVFPDCAGIHEMIAREMASLVLSRNAQGKESRFILPVGPVGQYPIFLNIIRAKRISLANCWFFFMDEYADSTGKAVPPSHPLSFQGIMRRLWLDHIGVERAVPEEQIVFPNESNIRSLAEKITADGGIDLCFGGIGIHGHLAFNEPGPGVSRSDPRKVRLNDYTVTINAMRAKVGGNIENFPRTAYTIGMKQILGAKKIRLACRNGIPLDWANTVLRLALFGRPGDDYPCTYLNSHPDYIIYTDRDTLKKPEIILEHEKRKKPAQAGIVPRKGRRKRSF